MSEKSNKAVEAGRAYKQAVTKETTLENAFAELDAAIQEITGVHNGLGGKTKFEIDADMAHLAVRLVNRENDNTVSRLAFMAHSNDDITVTEYPADKVLTTASFRHTDRLLSAFGDWLARALDTESFEVLASVLEGENAKISYDAATDKYTLRVMLVEDAIDKAKQSYTEQTGNPVVDGSLGKLTGATSSDSALKIAFDFAVNVACDRLIERPVIDADLKASGNSTTFSMTNYEFLFHRIARSGYYAQAHHKPKEVEFELTAENFQRLRALRDKYNVDFSQAIHGMFIEEVRL